jgi:hypothetical protein
VTRDFILFLTIPLVALASSLALADEIVVSTGRDGGSYFYIGERLKTELLISSEVPPVVLVVTSGGSMANLARLDDPESPVNIGLAQRDALDTYIASHPDFVEKFMMLGRTGPECGLLIVASNGPLSSAADLKKAAGLSISVDVPESGAAITYAKLMELNPAFQNTKPVLVDTMETLLQLKVGGSYSKLSGALLIQRPSRASAPVKMLLDYPDVYKLLPITEADVMSGKPASAASAYSFQEVSVGGSYTRSAPKIRTICTQGLLLAAKEKLSREMRARLSSIMLAHGDKIIGKAQ